VPPSIVMSTQTKGRGGGARGGPATGALGLGQERRNVDAHSPHGHDPLQPFNLSLNCLVLFSQFLELL